MARSGRTVRLAELGDFLGRPIEGAPETPLDGVAALDQAGPRDLSFVRSLHWAAELKQTKAGAVLIPDGLDPSGIPAIRSPHPSLDFARAAQHLVPADRPAAGLHPAATVASSAELASGVSIGSGATVGEASRIGSGTVLHAGVHVYPDVQVGQDCELHSGVVLREGTELGDRVIVHAGAVLGGQGFGFVSDEKNARIRTPQLGRLIIESDVEIGANTTIDRGSLGLTRVRRGAKIDNLVQIGHNCDIGEDAIIVAQSGLSGGTRIGNSVVFMAQAGSAGHLTVGEGAFVGARAGLHKDVASGARVYGAPALEERAWHRAMTALTRLPDLMRRFRAVERRLGLRPEGGDASDSDSENDR
ncbi:UDP-3-O-(3-hydroxymyristoyl)glucosamine N-acyltransferase [Myxococcota bacterium]|nr:UDP-3-O-(3-hydroxymyristoyl)glucosamine N-acyltransferase [Myxococcota bacterium]